MSDYLSDMQVMRIIYDEFSFERLGLKNATKPVVNLKVEISEDETQTLNIVSVTASVNKEKEYNLKVKISGFFEFSENITPDDKEEFLKKNAVAILMPYIRSQLSILTTQPETSSLMLPLMNINKVMADTDEEDEE